MNKNILIVRGFADKLDPKTYNLQEVGLGKEFVKQGYNCDIIYYTNGCEKEECVFTENMSNLKIFWTKGINVLKNAIYLKVLTEKYINKYDIVISNEYNQIMTYLLGKICPNKLVVYHGPYKDYDKNIVYRLYSKVFDMLFLNSIIKNTQRVFVKSKLAYTYLEEKGFKQILTVGVGLDTSKFDNIVNDNKYDDIFNNLKGKEVLLYVGKLEERRNIGFIIEVFESCYKKNNNIRLLFIGNGNKSDVDRYFKIAETLGVLKYITHIPRIRQVDLNIFYENSDLFIFPTSYDIFGMVLLESMYFGVPVISSINGGAVTLIDEEKAGHIIDEFEVEEWSKKIIDTLEDNKYRKNTNKEELKSIVNKYSWNRIAREFLENC